MTQHDTLMEFLLWMGSLNPKYCTDKEKVRVLELAALFCQEQAK